MALTDMVIMPGEDYQGACDALRSKTGTTAPICSGEMKALIEGIGGAELPELENPGDGSKVLAGYQLIGQDGSVVDGEIVSRTASDLTASGATVTVPAGHYAAQATKSVTTATQATPSITVSAAGLITAKATQSSGYVAYGTKQATKQLTTQAGTTVTPTTTEQTVVEAGTYVTGDIKVAAVPEDTGVELPELTNPGDASKLLAGYQLIDGDGAVVEGAIPTVERAAPVFSVTGDTVSVWAYQQEGYVQGGEITASKQLEGVSGREIMPGTTDHTVKGNRFLSGDIIVKGDPDLAPANIVKGATIFDVEGTAETGGVFVEPESKDVDFYDYDGTRLYSYTLAEAQALTELPPLPSREGLICQEWNWTLEEIKSWGKIADVGATYTTDDGATRIYIHLSSLLNMPMTLHYSQTVDAGVTIDWGDGSPTETASGTGAVSLSHDYASIGHYIISMAVTSGTASFDNGSVFGESYANQNSIQRVEIGDSLTQIGGRAFLYARGMTTISISSSVTSGATDNLRYSGLVGVVFPRAMSSLAFSYGGLYGCGALRMVSAAPTAGGSGITNNGGVRECTALRRLAAARVAYSINNYEFNGCQALETISYNPDPSLEQIGNSAFGGCISLREFEIPPSVTSIGTQAFYRCYSLQSLRFKPATPPTVANANAFTDLPATCVVEVPAASLAAYQAATNYSGIAAQMVGV